MVQLLTIGSPEFERILQEVALAAAKAGAEAVRKEFSSDWLSDEEAALLLSCTKRKLNELAAKKLIVRAAVSDRIFKFSRKSILSHLEDNIQK